MEALLGSSYKPTTTLLSSIPSNLSGFSSTHNNFLIFRNWHSKFESILSKTLILKTARRSLMVNAKKGNQNKNKSDKIDTHSFASKPDEATGPFPEAVLLKEKTVQDDGRALPEFADEEEEELFEYLNLQMESDLNVAQMRHYEVVYLIHQDYKDKVDNVNAKIQDFLKEKKGRVWRFSDWGMRKLAYKIKKTTHAHYILMNFELAGQWINDFKCMLDQDERVIRHLVIKRKKAITEKCPPPPEFHTLRADMTDETEVDDDDDIDDEKDEEWDDEDELDIEGNEDDVDIDEEKNIPNREQVLG